LNHQKFMSKNDIIANKKDILGNELPRRKQRGIVPSSLRSHRTFRPKGRGIRPEEIEFFRMSFLSLI